MDNTDRQIYMADLEIQHLMNLLFEVYGKAKALTQSYTNQLLEKIIDSLQELVS